MDEVERALLAQIAANPDDDSPRRVLGDHWLRGPDPARGELVIRQCAGDPAEDLVAAHVARWCAEAAVASVRFARGFAVPLVVDAVTPARLRLSPRLYVIAPEPARDPLEIRVRPSFTAAWLATDPRARFAILPRRLPLESDVRERALLATLDHPNIVALAGVAQQDGRDVTVIHWSGPALDGATFADRDTIAIGCQLARALAALHRRELVHGNLHRSSVFRDEAGHVRLAGLGHPPTFGGHYGPGAPELARGAPFAPPADVFAFGALVDALRADPDDTSALDDVVCTCTAAAPAERPTADALVAWLDGLA